MGEQATPPEQASGSIRTFLIADVRGYTFFTQQRGDEQAARLATRFADVVGRIVEAAGGRVVELRGDEALAVFDSPRQAIRAAVDLQRTFVEETLADPSLPLPVGIGLDAGEAIPVDGGFRGGALNLAARLCALAGPGEILATREVTHLARRTDGIRFVEGRAVRLKGLSEAVHVVQVRPESADPTLAPAFRAALATAPIPYLRIRLLGGADVQFAGEPLAEVETPRLQSLLAYLLLHRDAPQSRHHLAFMLWPDSSEAQALTNLRQALHLLRRAIPNSERYLDVGTKTVQWRADAAFWLDVAAFEEAAGRADREQDRERIRAALEEAATGYEGDLLPQVYDEWIRPERDRLRGRATETLEHLSSLLEKDGEYRRAIRWSEGLIRIDVLHEPAYQRLIRLHSLLGERARAVRIYHECAAVLERELGIEPSPATGQAYERLVGTEDESVDGGTVRTAGPPLVGRREEWGRSLEAWGAAAGGRPTFLLVTGEPGIGKSRLLEELQGWCARQGITTARGGAYAAEGRLAYAPVVEALRSDPVGRALRNLDPVWLTELARLLPELLAERPELAPPQPMGGPDERQRLFEAVARALLRGPGPGGGPLLLVLDDLQWADQETLEVLHYVMRFDPRGKLLLAATARDEERAGDHPLNVLISGLRALGLVVEVGLGPLDRGAAAELAGLVAGPHLAGARVEDLVRESEGNPLFLVETVRAGLAEGPGGAGSIPPRVQSVIEARLAQLSPAARAVVGLAATVGRQFTFEVLGAAADLDEDALVQALDELWRRRIVREHGASAYDFAHDRIREVAYSEIGPARRRQLHLAVARGLETLHGSDPGPAAAQLAAHYERAGDVDAAVKHSVTAARYAHGVFAYEEALVLVDRALGMLGSRPPSEERDGRELDLRTVQALSRVALTNYGTAEVRLAYERLDELCRRLGRPPTATLLRGMAMVAIAQCDHARVTRLGQQILDLGDEDPIFTVEGEYVLGVTSFWQGRFAQAREHLGRSIATYRPQRHRDHVALFGQDPQPVCLVRLAQAEWCLGYPDRARDIRDEAVALARRLEHPWTLGYVLGWATWLSFDLGEIDRVRQFADATVTVSGRRPGVLWGTMAPMFLSWLDVAAGKPLAQDRLKASFEAYLLSGDHLLLTYFQSLMARAHALGGDMVAALAAVEDALEFTQRTGHAYLEAELWRARAELLVGSGDRRGAESALQQALDVSTAQGARSFHLRTATAWARLMAARDPASRSTARVMMEEAYGWFTEGHGTADLREAHALLRELT